MIFGTAVEWKARVSCVRQWHELQNTNKAYIPTGIPSCRAFYVNCANYGGVSATLYRMQQLIDGALWEVHRLNDVSLCWKMGQINEVSLWWRES